MYANQTPPAPGACCLPVPDRLNQPHRHAHLPDLQIIKKCGQSIKTKLKLTHNFCHE